MRRGTHRIWPAGAGWQAHWLDERHQDLIHDLAGQFLRGVEGAEPFARWNREEAAVQREREIAVIGGDRVMHRHELRAVRERV